MIYLHRIRGIIRFIKSNINHNKYKSYNRYFLLITQEGQNGQVIIWYNKLSLSPDIKYIASNVLIFPFVWSEPKTFLLWQEQ